MMNNRKAKSVLRILCPNADKIVIKEIEMFSRTFFIYSVKSGNGFQFSTVARTDDVTMQFLEKTARKHNAFMATFKLKPWFPARCPHPD